VNSAHLPGLHRLNRERCRQETHIDTLGGQRRHHVGKFYLDDCVIALILEAMPLQHRAHADIHRAADAVVADDLAFELLHFFNRAVGKDREGPREVILIAVARRDPDQPQIVHMRVLDGERERRRGEIGKRDIAGRERRH